MALFLPLRETGHIPAQNVESTSTLFFRFCGDPVQATNCQARPAITAPVIAMPR